MESATPGLDEALIARRRAQNRLAQRRFRWKQSQNKAAAVVSDVQQQQQQLQLPRPRQIEPAPPALTHTTTTTPSADQDGPGNLTPRSPSTERVQPPSDYFQPFTTAPTQPDTPQSTCKIRGLFGGYSLLNFSDTMNFPREASPPQLSNTAPELTSLFLADDTLGTPTTLSSGQDSSSMSSNTTRHVLQHVSQDVSRANFSQGNIVQITTPDWTDLSALSSSPGRSSRSPANTKQAQNSGPPAPTPTPASRTRDPPPRRDNPPIRSNTDDDTGDGAPADATAAKAGEGDEDDKNGNGKWINPLHLAAKRGHNHIVRILLQHPVDCNEADSEGLTPLAHAVAGGYEDVVASLLQHGARLQEAGSDPQRRSALHWAVLHRRDAILRLLLRHCASEREIVNGRDSQGCTPLHTAVEMGFEAGVSALLENGANPSFRVRTGTS